MTLEVAFSSFGMLQDYDFDILKIDMSFIRKIGENPKQKVSSIVLSEWHMR